MRFTVRLDPDVEALLRKLMKEQSLSFKAALNQAVRDGITRTLSPKPRPYRLKTYRMGYRPETCLDQTLSLAAALEDLEIIRK